MRVICIVSVLCFRILYLWLLCQIPQERGPRRISLRQQGVAADGSSIDAEKRNGDIVIINGERIRVANIPTDTVLPRDRHPKGTHSSDIN